MYMLCSNIAVCTSSYYVWVCDAAFHSWYQESETLTGEYSLDRSDSVLSVLTRKDVGRQPRRRHCLC